MWRALAAFAALIGALALASRARFPETRSPQREKAALAAVVDAYVEANAAEDADALAALYADDALLLPPDAGLVEGQEGIRTFWQEGMEPGLAIEPVRVEIHGDAGLVVGRYAVPAQAEVPADSGKCVLMFRRSGGQWRITADIWNTSSPRPGEAPADPVEGDSAVVSPVIS